MGVGHAKDERFGEPEVLVAFGSRTLRKCTDGTMVPPYGWSCGAAGVLVPSPRHNAQNEKKSRLGDPKRGCRPGFSLRDSASQSKQL